MQVALAQRLHALPPGGTKAPPSRHGVEILGEQGVQLYFVGHMICQGAGELAVVGEGKAVRRVVDQRSQGKPLPQGMNAAAAQLLQHLLEMFPGILRVMPLKELMPCGAAHIGEGIDVRLHTAEQEQTSFQAAGWGVLPRQQKTPQQQMIFFLHG